MSHWMEPKARVVELTPLQLRQHRQSLQTSEAKLEEVKSRAGKSPGPTTRKVMRDLENHIAHTRNLLGEKAYIAHKDGTDEFLGPDPKKQKPAAAGKESAESEPMEMLEKVKIVVKAIETEMIPNLEKHLEPAEESPAPKVEKAMAPGIQKPKVMKKQPAALPIQLSLFGPPAAPKPSGGGKLSSRLKLLNKGKTSI